jgi:uncharacterized protein YqeY
MLTKHTLEQELHQAMRSGDDLRKRTLRLALAAIQLAEVEARGPLDEAGLTGVVRKEIKTRMESIHDAEAAGRTDLATRAQEELQLLEAYLPPGLTRAELEQLARQAIQEAGATTPGEFGAVMKVLMPRLEGRADGKTAGDVVRSLLTPS